MKNMKLDKIKLTDPFVLIGLLVIVAGVLMDFLGIFSLGAIFGLPLLSLVAVIVGLVLIYYSTTK
jgi:uncharacterized membrane protein